jgi:addiction module HigA family antidote
MIGEDLIRREDFGAVDLSDMVEPDAAPLPPAHPGDVLRHDFLEPLGLSANALALALRVPANRITAILNGERAITAETALRLARHFGTTPGFWLNLQKNYELEAAEREVGERIRAEVSPRPA